MRLCRALAQVLVGEHDALRRARRPTGVRDGGERVAVDAGRVDRVALEQDLVLVLEIDHRPAELLRDLSPLRVGEHHAEPGVLGHEGQLGGGEPEVQVDHDPSLGGDSEPALQVRE
jgi:hypothetical protein